MDTDMKWVGLLLLVFMVFPMGGMLLSDYQHSQCRLEAIKAQMPGDEIIKVCGK